MIRITWTTFFKFWVACIFLEQAKLVTSYLTYRLTMGRSGRRVINWPKRDVNKVTWYCWWTYYAPLCRPCFKLFVLQFSIILQMDRFTTTVLRLFFWDHPGALVPEENFSTLWCKGRLTEADTQDNPAERHSIWTNQCPPPPSSHFIQAGCPSCRATNSVKALKATSAWINSLWIHFISMFLPLCYSNYWNY